MQERAGISATKTTLPRVKIDVEKRMISDRKSVVDRL